MSVALELFKQLTKRYDHKLTEVTIREELSGEVKILLDSLYEDKNSSSKIMASIFNSIRFINYPLC